MKSPYISNILRFSSHDGEGLRTVVFVSGCFLDCVWCHNPESRLFNPGIFYINQSCIACGLCGTICPKSCHTFEKEHIYNRKNCILCYKCTDICPSGALTKTARQYSVEEIISIVKRDKIYYGKDGGLTLSGGEPLAFPEFTLSLLKAAKKEGINTCIESSGSAERGVFEQTAPYLDLLLYDIKDTNFERHKTYTGVYPDIIIENLRFADALGIKTILRCIMVKGVNMEDAHYDGIKRLFSSLKNCLGAELLPCHAYGESKRAKLGLATAGCDSFIPSPEDMEYAKERLKEILI